MKVVMKVCFIIQLMEFVLGKKIVQKIITLILKIVNVNNLVSIMMICLVMIAGKDVLHVIIQTIGHVYHVKKITLIMMKIINV